ncbi:leukocyte elastase inhibitor-like isoform X1 [Eriocheir sinensis]|uniref:leukocyte elastase inhibitor-like isoform X1 n=2 Tax=Eriocheir sinensis TaxID=95602 RepID=UPI0021C7274E|nr:leukocyte elastase inhibitor-like isoform X1 [Eriocheir sinensis]
MTFHRVCNRCQATLVLWSYTIFVGLFVTVAAMQHPQEPSFPPYANQEAVRDLAASQNNFTRDLYMKLAAGGSGNLFFSPFSIMTALGMTYAGAGGNTEQEMRSVMHLGEDKEASHRAFQDVVSDLKAEVAEYELRTSNMAYVSGHLAVLSEFDNILREKYLSSSKTVDFGKSEEVRQEINTAVEKETNSRIKDLIPAGMLNSLTRMVLVNAIYFKGFWANQFKKEATRDEDFWTSSTDSVKVPMMHMKEKFRLFHFRDLGATALAMDYKGSRLSMVFVLPDERDGLAGVEAKLATTDLSELDKKLRKAKVEVTIPRFKLEETLDLSDKLQEMGMKDLFDEESADLSGISGKKDLFVSNVVHKAFLEVNEEGSEAAAATEIRIMRRSLPMDPLRFTADHPFFFYIRDHQSNCVLFAGRLVILKNASLRDEL